MYQLVSLYISIPESIVNDLEEPGLEISDIEPLDKEERKEQEQELEATEGVNKLGFKLTPENSISVGMDMNSNQGYLVSKEGLFFNTLGGTKYQITKRWEAVLDGICKTINPGLITNVEIYKNVIILNGKVIEPSNIIGGQENIRIGDIVNYEILGKRFKAIKAMKLDGPEYDDLMFEFKDNTSKLLKAFKNLRRIYVVQQYGKVLLLLYS